jgi:hypothetical protein
VGYWSRYLIRAKFPRIFSSYQQASVQNWFTCIFPWGGITHMYGLAYLSLPTLVFRYPTYLWPHTHTHTNRGACNWARPGVPYGYLFAPTRFSVKPTLSWPWGYPGDFVEAAVYVLISKTISFFVSDICRVPPAQLIIFFNVKMNWKPIWLNLYQRLIWKHLIYTTH